MRLEPGGRRAVQRRVRAAYAPRARELEEDEYGFCCFDSDG